MILKVAGLLFDLLGWKFHNEIPDSLRTFVLIGGPHTSNFDIIAALGVCYYSKRNMKFVIKSEWMRFPFNLLLGPAGAIPLVRAPSKEVAKVSNIKLMAQKFSLFDEMVMLIAPEGTRKARANWKTGWYYIAQEAGVPVVMGYLDYKTKTAGLGPLLPLTGDIEADLKKVAEFYSQFTPKHVGNFKLPI